MPTHQQNFVTNPSKQSIKLASGRKEQTEASPHNYKTSPKYAHNYGLAPHNQVIANYDRATYSNSKVRNNITHSTNSSVNFILPS